MRALPGKRTPLISLLALIAGCGPPPPVVVAPKPPPPLPPLERICGDTLPMGERTVGEWVRTLRAIDPAVKISQKPCDAGTVWPIAFYESEAGKPPVGIALLQMEGDALLTLDSRDRDAPTVKLCAELEASLDDRHRFWATALWDSGDDAAMDPERLADSRAELAWVEVRTRAPSECALGKREPQGQVADPELRAAIHCAMHNFVTPVPEGCPPAPIAPATDIPAGASLDQALVAMHHFSFPGREKVRDRELVMARRETCVHEPEPSTRDLCLAEYTRNGHPDERWFGRGDVTRTGTGGVKNYVDSYLTIQTLKRLEAERRKNLHPAPPPKPPQN